MSKIPVFQVDAFTDRPFSGNPAAVCLLEQEAEADWMQSVAAEMNLSETAFLVARDDGFQLRWFTPTIEVPLCGHATLASSHVLWLEGKVPRDESIRFHTLSGLLTATLDGAMIELDFPAAPVMETDPPAGLLEALDVAPTFVGQSDYDMFVVVESERVVRELRLLQQDDVGLDLAQPGFDSLLTGPERVDVPGDDVEGLGAHGTRTILRYSRSRPPQALELGIQPPGRGPVPVRGQATAPVRDDPRPGQLRLSRRAPRAACC